MIRFEIPGEPTGKARPRVTRYGTHTPEKTVLYENLVKTMYPGELMEGQLQVSVKAFYGIPKSTPKRNLNDLLTNKIRPTKLPDVDNILKIILDALNKIAYYDDKQVVKATVEKFYSIRPHVEVELDRYQEGGCK